VLSTLTGHPHRDPELMRVDGLRLALGAGLLVHTVVLALDLCGAHAGLDARRAARLITHGDWPYRFWIGVVGGIAAPVGLMLWALAPRPVLGVALAEPVASTLAALLALASLWVYEDLWVKAGQAVPLS
jgi:hypothetical protein